MPPVTVRPPRPEDAEAAFAVIAARDSADLGFVDYTLGDLHSDWNRPDVDSWVAELDGRIAGTAAVDALGAMVCVDPAAEGKGVGTALRGAVEARMRERGQPLLRQAIAATNHGARRLLAAAGYGVGHVYLTLRADLAAPQAAARGAPAEAAIRPLERPGDEVPAHRLIQETFADIEGNVEQPFDDWRADRLDRADLELPVWLLLEDAEGLAGVLTGRSREGIGYVEELGVARRARGRGHGRALLLAAFEHFRSAGLAACELSVHGRNASAQGLYASVGLREERRAERWERPA